MSERLDKAMETLHARVFLNATPTMQELDLLIASQEYLVDLTMDSESLSTIENFTFLDGVLTYTGANPIGIEFVGATTIKASKVATVSLMSYVNGALSTSTDYPFTSAGSQGPFNSTSIKTISNGDTIEVRAASDSANTTITFISYKLKYSGYQHAVL